MNDKIYLTRITKDNINILLDDIFKTYYNKEYLELIDYCQDVGIKYNSDRIYKYDIISSYEYKELDIHNKFLTIKFKSSNIVIKEDINNNMIITHNGFIYHEE